MRDVLERFMSFASPEPNTGCWLWTGAIDREGYGRFGLNRKNKSAYRLGYEMMVGPVPPGLELDHLCRQRSCVNPDHLEPVTHRENSLRGENCMAWNARKTHCPQGHPYSEENTLILLGGGRRCITCKREEARRYYWKKREK